MATVWFKKSIYNARTLSRKNNVNAQWWQICDRMISHLLHCRARETSSLIFFFKGFHWVCKTYLEFFLLPENFIIFLLYFFFFLKIWLSHSLFLICKWERHCPLPLKEEGWGISYFWGAIHWFDAPNLLSCFSIEGGIISKWKLNLNQDKETSLFHSG